MLQDIGVAFKMTGADSFDGTLKRISDSYNNLSRSLDRSPNVDKHFGQMARSAQTAAQSIQRSMTMAKAAIAAALTAKGLGAGFDWALGNAEVDAKRDRLRALNMDRETESAYSKAINEARKRMASEKADAWDAVYQIDSAMADKDLKTRLDVFNIMPHYSKILEMTQGQSAEFFKGLYAAFGQFLPAEKQATFAQDVLGRIYGASKATKVNPKDVATAASDIAPIYQQMGRGLDDMVTDLAFLIPVMGGKSEKAATALRNTFLTSGEVFGKVAKAVVEANFKERFMKNSPWKTIEDLKFAANYQGNEQAQEMLKALTSHQEYFAQQQQTAAGKILLQEKNVPKYMNLLGGMIDRLKAEGGDWMGKLGDAIGRENVTGILALVDGYRKGLLQKTRDAIQVGGDEAISKAQNEGMQSANAKWKLVKQQAEDLSADIRQMISDPLIQFLEQWKQSLEQVRGMLGNEKTGAIQKNLSGFAKGFFGGLGEGLLGPGQSFEKYASDKIKSMQGDGWDKAGQDAGQKLGSAVSTFATAAQQFAEIVAKLHSLLIGKKEDSSATSQTSDAEKYGAKGAAGMIGNRAFGSPGLIAGLLFGDDLANSAWGLTALGAAAGFSVGGPAGILPGAAAGAAVKPFKSLVQQEAAGRGIDMHSGGYELNSYMNQPSQVVVQPNTKVENKIEIIADEEKLAGALSARVKSEIKEELSSERDRGRNNALDWPWK